MSLPVLAQGVFDVQGDSIPTASMTTTSLVTPRTEWISKSRVRGVPNSAVLVRHFHLPLSTPLN
jgi:hypothetical protein